MIHSHKLLFLLVVPATWSAFFLGVHFGGLTVEKLRPWGGIFAVATLVLLPVLVALDSPYADVAMLLSFSFTLSVEWIAWFERRAKQAS